MDFTRLTDRERVNYQICHVLLAYRIGSLKTLDQKTINVGHLTEIAKTSTLAFPASEQEIINVVMVLCNDIMKHL